MKQKRISTLSVISGLVLCMAVLSYVILLIAVVYPHNEKTDCKVTPKKLRSSSKYKLSAAKRLK